MRRIVLVWEKAKGNLGNLSDSRAQPAILKQLQLKSQSTREEGTPKGAGPDARV